MADKKYLPYVVGGDIITFIQGTKTNTFPTQDALADYVNYANIINKMPQLVPQRDIIERKVLSSQQAIQSGGMRPAIDGTMDIYYDCVEAAALWSALQSYQSIASPSGDEAQCFWVVWYSRVRDTTYAVRATTDTVLPSPEGESGDVDVAEIPLYNIDETITEVGNKFPAQV